MEDYFLSSVSELGVQTWNNLSVPSPFILTQQQQQAIAN